MLCLLRPFLVQQPGFSFLILKDLNPVNEGSVDHTLCHILSFSPHTQYAFFPLLHPKKTKHSSKSLLTTFIHRGNHYFNKKVKVVQRPFGLWGMRYTRPQLSMNQLIVRDSSSLFSFFNQQILKG